MRQVISPPVTPKAILTLRKAHGAARIYAVGVSNYDPTSGFKPLKVCTTDARAVRDRFTDIEQLNAERSSCIACTSNSERPPTRGEIVAGVRRLANEAEANHRIIFYFSGHGHRLGEKFFLVPQDAWDSDNPDALLAFDTVLDLLNKSAAKQKLVVLDACFSGPETKQFKALAQRLSIKFLAEYFERTNGVAILSSCGIDERSTAKSPNPNLSLFTRYFVHALGGEPEALDQGRLTLSSVFDYLSVQVARTAKSYNVDQQPTLYVSRQGVLLLGDFSLPLVAPESLELGKHPVDAIDFEDAESEWTKSFLTKIKDWSYSADWLESRVNAVLGEKYEERLGRSSAKISAALGIPLSEIAVENSTITFPGAIYSVSYEIDQENKKEGLIRHNVSLSADWFGDPARITLLLDALDLSPSEMVLHLNQKVNLERFAGGLRARRWIITSVLQRKIEASLNGLTLVIEPRKIRLCGFTPDELFGDCLDPNKVALAGSVLSLIPDTSAG
jgi:hypothetical protein